MQIKTKRETIVDALQKIKGIGDFQMVAETEKVALKKSRITKVPTPDRFARISKVTLATISLGNEYEKEVNARLLKEGKDDSFKSQGTYCVPLSQVDDGLKGFVHTLMNKIGLTFMDKLSKVIYKHKEREQLYVRVYPNLAKSYQSHSVYFDANGVELTKEEFKAIEAEYLPLDTKIGKGDNPAEKFIDKIDLSQGGLDNKIIVNNYKLENILYLADGDKNPINELTEEKLNLVRA